MSGWKFAEWEMKGVPLRLELGPRDLAEGKVALSKRYNGEKLVGAIEDVEAEIPALLKAIQEEMYQKALAFLQTKIVDVENLEELKAALEKGGYARMAYCGEPECEDAIKAFTNGGTARCIYKEEVPEGSVCPVCGKPSKIVAYFAKAY